MMLTLLTSCGLFNKGNDTDDDATCKHTNTSIQGAKPASCDSEGYTGDTVCNDCTAVVTPGSAIPKTAHTYDNGKVTKNPTCAETGLTTFTCSGCGAIETSVIATVDHDDQFHDAQDGTHFHTCKNCPLNENAQHNPKDAGKEYPATCTEPAYTELVCADCNGVYKLYAEGAVALGHDWSGWETTKESTCKSSGKKVQVCQREGCNEKNTVTIPKSTDSHSFSFDYYSSIPNCTSGGQAVYSCDDCGTPDYKYLEKNGVHSYEPLESTGDGWVRKECIYCYDVIASFDASQLKEAEVAVENIDTESALEMNMQSAGIQFPQDVVGQITSGTNLSVSADVLDETAKEEAINNLPEEEKAILADAPIFDFTVKVDNTVFTDNFSTKVAITVDYVHTEADGEGIVIYYLANDGTIEEITDVTYDAEKQQVTFFVDHFSYYAVAYKETQAMRCKRGNHSYVSTGVTVAPNCYTFGYTVYECVGCHRSTFDDIVERTEHNYGDLIDANPTCDRGDYITRVCQNEGCGDVLNVKFVGATGHVMDKPATCTTPSVCTKCNRVLTRALGHTWTEWETVVEATGTKDGLRRRYCTTCGEVQESKIASTGIIDEISYDSYVELFEKVFGEILGINSGVIDFYLEADGNMEKVSVKLMKTERGYRAYFTTYYTNTDNHDNEEPLPDMGGSNTGSNGNVGKPDYSTYEPDTYTYVQEFYYENGVVVMLRSRESDGRDDYKDLYASDLDNVITLPIDMFKEILEELHAEIDVYMVDYRDYAESAIETFCNVAGDEIDDILAELGLPFYASQLENVLDSIETVYAYLCAKLGLSTGIEKVDGVELPTAEDWENTLSVFMNHTTDENGITTYTLDEAPIIDLAEGIVSYLEKHLNDTASEFIYDAFMNTFLTLDASITDFDAFVSYLKTNFHGNYTLADAFDIVLDAASENGLTADDVYEAIDTIVASRGNAEFDTKAFIDENGAMTLDQIIQNINGDEDLTIEDFYDALAEQLDSITVREMYLDGATVEEICTSLRTMKDGIQLNIDFAFSVDSEGLLTSIKLDQDLWVYPGFDTTSEPVKLDSIKINIERNTNVTIDIPEELKPAMRDVNNYYDADGNLIITGLDGNIDYDFSVRGSTYKDYSEILVKDETLSNEQGKNIYVNKPEYWTATQHLGWYYLVDGKYYKDYNYYYYIEVYETTKLSDKIDTYVTVEKEMRGYLVGHDDVPVYPIYMPGYGNIGIAYCLDGVWMAATGYGRVQNIYSDDGYYYYYVTNPTTLDAFIASIDYDVKLDSNSNSYILYNGNYYQSYNIRFIIDDYVSSYYSYNIFNVDGEYLVATDYNNYYVYSVEGCEPVELPSYDYKSEYDEEFIVIGENGEISFVQGKEVSLYNYVPTYYLKVTDNSYIRMNSSYLYSSCNTNGLEARVLSDGNTLYVIGETMGTDYGYKFGYNAVYGYAETADGFYVQCALLLNGDEVVEIKYRDAEDSYYFSFRNAYDVESYVTKKANGDYVISKELVNQLKANCKDPGDAFYFDIEAEVELEGFDSLTYSYMVGGFMIKSDVSFNDINSGSIDDWNFWWQLNFTGGGEGEKPVWNDYNVVKNDDGSITLVFGNGYTISEIYYYSVIYVPVEDELVKDNDKSNETGLDIYKYEDKYIGTSTYVYVYKDGKYYHYSERSVYELRYLDDINVDWYIDGFYYRFNMIGADGLPADLPVYETSISIRWKYTYSDGGFGTASTYLDDFYTFYIDGVLNVAVGAEVTGESLLTFESYMPFNEYMASLEFEYDYEYVGDSYSSYFDCYLGNGEYAKLYDCRINVYETDADGNENYITSLNMYYVNENGTKKIVNASHVGWELLINNEADLSHIPANANRSEYKNSWFNGTFDLVYFEVEQERTVTYYFVKLAGRLYRYNSYGNDYYDDYKYSYEYQKLDEWSFNNQATDKAWVYMVEITDEYGDVIDYVYYSEFIPSDLGFTPSGDIVDPSIIGEVYSKTILGYTKEGYALYEIAYWVTGDESPYTRETMSDGTVFVHKDGVGYLEVTEKYGYKYYVRARKVTMDDGSTEIYCFLRGAVLRADHLHDSDELLKDYISYEGNKLTISEDFLQLIKDKSYNDIFRVYIEHYGNVWFDYYQLQSLFMMAE